MALRRWKRWRSAATTGTLVAVAGLALAGCATTRQVPLETIPVEGTGKATVHTQDQYTYNFDQVHVSGDSLIGTYYVVEERISADGDVAYVDVPRQTVLLRDRVARVEVRRLDYGNTALLGAGAALFTVWLTSLSDENEPQPRGGGGKILPDP